MENFNPSHSEENISSDVNSMSSLLKKGFSLILVLIAILASINIYQLQKSKQQLNELVSINIQKMAQGSIMRDSIRQRTISIYKMFQMEDYFDRDDELIRFYKYAQRYVAAREIKDSLGISDIEKELNSKISDQIKIAQPITRDVAESMLSNISREVLKTKVSFAITSQEKLYSLLDELNSLQENQSEKALQDINKNFTYIMILTFIVTIIVIFLCLQIAIKLYSHVINTSNILSNKNIDLKQAYIKAEESTKTKSEFLAKMSHEIRTPMNGVMGMLQLLLTEDLNDVQKDYAQTALNSSKSLLTIINDILDFSKMEAGKLDINNMQFSLSSTINDVVATVENSAQVKNIKLSYFIKSDVEEYYVGDSNRISQILINLIGNAIKFTEQGGVDVIISLNESDDEFSLLKIEVSDSGIGISDEAKSSLFTSFTQVDNTISRIYGGTGLGLSICKQLCNLMGGDIGVYNGENGGSVFWFTLKLARVEDQENSWDALNTLKDEKILKPQPAVDQEPLDKKKILIVEDKEVNQVVTQKMLEKLNYVSDLAENGKIAIEKIKSQSYDLILMDCHMPYMDGFEATQIIREIEKEKNISHYPIIALTGNAMKGDREKCLDSGMDDFLAKPFKMSDLSKIIEKWINKEAH